MKKLKKIIAAAAAICLIGATAASLAACDDSPELVATYTTYYNQNNVAEMPGYQFVKTNNFFVAFDARVNCDITLELYDDNTYVLTADHYVIENGERTPIPSETGCGMTVKTVAEGTYTQNEDGTQITIAPATTATYTVESDEYSAQMVAMGFSFNTGTTPEELDGEWFETTGEVPEDKENTEGVLDMIPETIFTVEGDEIVTYSRVVHLAGTYTTYYNQINATEMPDYQFVKSNNFFVAFDARVNCDITLELYDDNTYVLTADHYVIENGERTPIPSETGCGMTVKTVAKGTYTQSEDGTQITISSATSATYTVECDEYSAQMVAMGFSFNEGTTPAELDGEWTEATEPEVLDMIPATIFTVNGDSITTWEAVPTADEGATETN